MSSTARLGLAAIAISGVVLFQPLKNQLSALTQHPESSGWVLAAAVAAVTLGIFSSQISLVWQFVWNCFLQPLGKNDSQKGRLDRFYQGQAESAWRRGALGRWGLR